MDNDTLESNINMLKEMILDEQKLVTYVSISKDLFIHVNDSKKLLTAVVEDIKKKQPETGLNVSYIISGLSEDNKARTTVASEKDIDKLRSSFPVVFFEHIYSVGKGTSCVDNVSLLAVNKFEDYSLCTGLIKNNSCTKRTSDEIGNLKSSSQKSVETESKSTAPPQKKAKEEVKKVVQNGKDDTKNIAKVHESKSEPIIKTEVPSPKKDTSNSKQAIDNKKNGNKTQQKGIAGFFSKSNSAPTKKVTKTLEPKKEICVKEEKNTIVEPVEVMEVDEEVPVKKEPKEVKKPKNKNSNEKSKNNSLTQIKKNAKVDKKRKRVLHVSDSESDDEKNDPFVDDEEPVIPSESDDEIPPTPTVNTVKITSGIINPKKKRKIVDKTYTDEDGYILTKKEEVYESCSDNEEVSVKENIEAQPQVHLKLEVSPKDKKTPKNSKKKISPPQKGKQATLMNFFKKV